MSQEDMIAKVREIYKDEQFRLDAYYLCGFASGTPNEKLANACGKFLEAVDGGQPTTEAADTMIALMEETVGKSKKNGPVDIVDNTQDIQEVLDHRDLLFA